jgi:hypothetical protein
MLILNEHSRLEQLWITCSLVLFIILDVRISITGLLSLTNLYLAIRAIIVLKYSSLATSALTSLMNLNKQSLTYYWPESLKKYYPYLNRYVCFSMDPEYGLHNSSDTTSHSLVVSLLKRTLNKILKKLFTWLSCWIMLAVGF